MNSTTGPELVNPHDAAVAVILQAYEQISRADNEQPDEQAFELEKNPDHQSLNQQKRSAFLGHRGRRITLLQGGTALLLAGCVLFPAFAWHSYADDASSLSSGWVSEGASISSIFLVKQDLPAPPSQTVEVADAALPQPTPLARTRSEDVAPPGAPISPDVAEALQLIANGIGNLQQAIERLKTTQEQIGRDNVRAVGQLKASQEQFARENMSVTEQLRASQEQLARDNAKLAEQIKVSQEQIARAIPKTSEQTRPHDALAPLPKPTASPINRPVPTAPRQARAQQQAPRPAQQ